MVGLSIHPSVHVIGVPWKMAGPIEVPFGIWTRVGRSNHVFDGDRDPSRGRGNFGMEKGPTHSKVLGGWTVSPEEMAGSMHNTLQGFMCINSSDSGYITTSC